MVHRFALTALLGAVLCNSATAQTAPYDLLLKNARVVDGTGSPWYRADVAIRGDAIVRIAPAITEPATRVIDVDGQVVAPGFIDIHTHARRGIFEIPTAENYVRQGVTTLIEGPDGGSPVPLGPFLARLDSLPKSVNIASFIGQLDPFGRDRRREPVGDCGGDPADAGHGRAGNAGRRAGPLLPTVLRAGRVHGAVEPGGR